MLGKRGMNGTTRQQLVETTRRVSISPVTYSTPAACAVRIAASVTYTTNTDFIPESFQRLVAAEIGEFNLMKIFRALQSWPQRTHQHRPLGVSAVAVGTPRW